MFPVRFTRCLGSPLASRLGFDPFLELDRVADSLFGDREPFGISVDVREDDDHYIVEADVPGFHKEDVEVTFEDGVLSVSGERKREESREGENYHVSERRIGKFQRSFRLPNDVDLTSVEARIHDGVLRVTLAKSEEVKPRRIEVKAE